MTAVDRYGRVQRLDNLSFQAINELKQKDFYCPACRQAVILKNGLQKSAHFAHCSQTACWGESETESLEHIAGKNLLAAWCRKNSIPFKLEAYLPEIQQRPDLLIKHKWAIEFQCSPLSLSTLSKRTKSYLASGYQVIWVVGEKFHLNTRQAISALQRAFLYVSQPLGFYIWELSVLHNELRICSHIEQTAGSQKLTFFRQAHLLTRFSTCCLWEYPEQATIYLLHEINPRQIVERSRSYFLRQLRARRFSVRSVVDFCYFYRLNPNELPDCFFLPFHIFLPLKTHQLTGNLYLWQSLLNKTDLATNFLVKQFLQENKLVNWQFYSMPNVSIYSAKCYFLQTTLNLFEKLGWLTFSSAESISMIDMQPLKRKNGYLSSRSEGTPLPVRMQLTAIPNHNVIL